MNYVSLPCCLRDSKVGNMERVAQIYSCARSETSGRAPLLSFAPHLQQSPILSVDHRFEEGQSSSNNPQLLL